MRTTAVFGWTLAAYVDPAVRVIANEGSSRSAKTWSTLQTIVLIAVKSKKPRLISIVSETLPHLRKGCIRDFKAILEAEGIYDPDAWNETEKIYRLGKCTVEFFSVDQASKVMGPSRDILYINECIHVPFEIYRQLAVRTREKIFLDHNPVWEFWVHTRLLARPGTRLIKSTYRDNRMLTRAQVEELESNRETDPEWWKVYGEGMVGSKQGLCIQNWDIVPYKRFRRIRAKREWIGIDFGWSKPTAIMHIKEFNGEVYIDEIAYKTDMDNEAIAQAVKDAGLKGVTVVADSAEPKSIAELKKQGLTVIPADKGDDSIRIGIQIMNRYKKHYTDRSLGSIDENRKYRWPPADELKPEDSKPAKPIDANNHAKDAERYVFVRFLGNIDSGFDLTTSEDTR